MNKELKLNYLSDNNWTLYNGESLELDSSSYETYSNLFESIYKPEDYDKNHILIIGGGDFQLLNSLKRQSFSFVTVVDPLIKDFKKFDKILNTKGHRCVIEYPMTFNRWFYNIHKDSVYDYVIVDCSEGIVSETEEIYNLDFIETLESLIKTDGTLYIYIPPEILEFFPEYLETLKDTFELDEGVEIFVDTWEENANFYRFKKNFKSQEHTHISYLARSKSPLLKNVRVHNFRTNIERILRDNSIELINFVVHPFSYGGHSGSILLGGSHFNWHTYPEERSVVIDMYHCNKFDGYDKIFNEITSLLQVEENKYKLEINKFDLL